MVPLLEPPAKRDADYVLLGTGGLVIVGVPAMFEDTAVASREVAGQCGLLGTKFLISAQNMERAVAFYRDVIGLEVRVQSPWWSELTHGTSIVALHGGGSGEFGATGLSFTVRDIDAACAAVVRGGGTVRSDPEDRGDEGIYLAELADPEGNGFMMSQVK